MSRNCKLGDIAELSTGPFGSQLHKNDYVNTGIPVVMPQNINELRNVDHNGIAQIGDSDYRRLSRHALLKNDIVFARRGEVDKHAFIVESDLPMLCGTGCLRVRVKDAAVNPHYLSLYLSKPDVKARLRQHAVGSNMPNLNTGILSEIPIDLPDKFVQDSVVDLLGAIDDKIRANQGICKELEDTISLIYDYWFTQFDFPDENGRPYRSSGGSVSSAHKIEKPSSWKLGQLDDFVQICSDSVSPSAMPSIVEHYSIPAFDNMHYPSFDSSVDIQSSKYRVSSDSFLISKLNPQFKRVWNPLYLTDVPVCSTEFVVLRCKAAIASSYIFSVLNSNRFQSFMQSNAIASTGSRSRVQPERILKYVLPVPPDKILHSFNEDVHPMLELEKTIRIENHNLTNLRDWLLPMLMNGQIRTSELGIGM